MAEKVWKTWHNECQNCGDGTDILTESTEAFVASDGDTVRCIGCGSIGYLSVFEAGDAFVDWE